VIVAAPARRLAALRLLTGTFAVAYLLVRLPYFFDLTRLPADRWDPPGVLGPLGSPPPEGLVRVLLALAILAGLGYVAGWHYRVTGPLFAVLLLGVMSYRNAWGHLFHTDNLVVLHVLIVGLAPAAAAWSLDARGRTEPDDDVRFGWPVRLAALATVLTYVVTGIAKLRYAGLDWLGGDTLLHQIAFDNARKKVLGDTYSPFAAAFAGHPGLFRPLGVLTLVVELGAPVALLGRRWAAWWCGAAWLFHVGILGLMWISFPYPLSLVAFAPFFRCERFVEAILGLRPVRRLVSA
jgi:Vitamin K-dependent gamma-carboxylase